MGRIAELLGKVKDLPKETPARLWREAFSTSKEQSGHDQWRRERKPPIPGGTWGRSAANDNSLMRLLLAQRSNAPGGWQDDKYEQSRHFVSLPYVAIHRQNELLTQAEFQVFRKDKNHPDGKVPVDENTPASLPHTTPYDLVELLEKPNPDDGFGDLMGNWNLQMDLTGMGLTWMVPNQFGTPMELYPIPTATAVPGPCLTEDYPDGYYQIQPLYPYGPFSSYPTPFSAVGARIPAQWMLRFKYPHPLLRYEGYSPLSALRLLIDEVEMIDRSRHYKMRRSSNPDAVVNCTEMDGMEPLPSSEIDRIHAEWEANNQGPENAGRLIVAPPGMEIQPWGANPVDMDYTAGWEQLTSFCLGGLGITKPAAGMIEDASYATLFATLKQLYWLTLEPKADRIGRKLTRHLAPFFGKDLIVEVRCRRIDDHDVKNAKLQMLIGSSAITYNQLLKECEMPVTNDPWGEWRVGMDEQYMNAGGEDAQQDPNSQADAALQDVPGMSDGTPGFGGTAQPGQTVGPRTADAGMDAANDDMTNAQGLPLDEQEIARTQPTPGKLGRGALGPRMKSFSRNGHSKSNAGQVIASLTSQLKSVSAKVDLLEKQARRVKRA